MTLKLSPQVIRLLEQLTATGFYGATPSGTAEALLKEKLREILAKPLPPPAAK